MGNVAKYRGALTCSIMSTRSSLICRNTYALLHAKPIATESNSGKLLENGYSVYTDFTLTRGVLNDVDLLTE